jgi:27-O-demethylrifamycin SV methyltransferase
MPQPSPQAYYEALNQLLLEMFGHDWHLGYWLNASTYEEAAQRLNELMAGRLDASAGMTVLDVGCGVGGPACNLSVATGARVVGLSNSAAGVAEAERYTRERGLSEWVSYRLGEATAMPFPDASFDAVYSCEAIHNVEDPGPLAHELARVLKPGGAVVIGDLFLLKTPDADGPDLARLKQFSFHLVTADTLIAALQDSGLRVTESLSIGHHVGPRGPELAAAQCRERAARTPAGTVARTILDRTTEATTLLAQVFRRREVSWGIWVGHKA